MIESSKCLAFFEMAVISTLFQDVILSDCRFIDDKIGIFTDDGSRSFDLHKHYLNKVCKLDCVTGPLSEQVIFLDLIITLDRFTCTLKHKPYTKPENVFLYIPPNLAHPPGTYHGMIVSIQKRKWTV